MGELQTIQYIHFSIELWGAFLGIVAAVSVSVQKAFDRRGSNKLINILICCSLLLACDAFAWLFRGNPSPNAGLIVRSVNYLAFLFGFLIMPLVADYITYIICKRSDIEGLYWKYIEFALFIAGAFLITLNIFKPFMYAFDDHNAYYRLQFGYLPGLITLLGLSITLSVVFQYNRYLRKFEKVAMVLYLLLPIISVTVQIFFYGISFTNIAIIASTFLLYIAFEVNYNEYYRDKEKILSDERIRLFNRQMQPHFIHNSLGVIKYLCRKDPDEARLAIDELSGYLRSSTNLMSEDDCVSVESELELVRHYIYMQKKRFSDRFDCIFDIKDKDFDMPPFTIQTCVDNAIKHGLRPKEEFSGTVIVRTYLEKGNHITQIEDDGVGFDPDILNNTSFTKKHVGIINSQKRLGLMCNGSINIKSTKGTGTIITITIPAKSNEE